MLALLELIDVVKLMLGLIDKIVGIYELISPSGQNSWCLFLPDCSFFVLNLDIRLIKQNGNGLCWGATCQG